MLLLLVHTFPALSLAIVLTFSLSSVFFLSFVGVSNLLTAFGGTGAQKAVAISIDYEQTFAMLPAFLSPGVLGGIGNKPKTHTK